MADVLVKFRGKEAVVSPMSVDGYIEMAGLLDELTLAFEGTNREQAERTFGLMRRIAKMMFGGIEDAELGTATVEELLDLLAAGWRVNNVGAIARERLPEAFRAAAAPAGAGIPDPGWEDSLASLAALMGDAEAARRIRSRKRSFEILRGRGLPLVADRPAAA